MENSWPTKINFHLKPSTYKDVTLKNEAQIKCKQYRNLLSTLMKVKNLISQTISKTT